MRVTLIALLLLGMSLFASPSWFNHIPAKTVNTYIGYGVGRSGALAKQEALNDIATQISVSINSSMSSDIKDDNGKIKRVDESSVVQKTVATLYDYKLLKSEYEDGKYFVALSYENIPSLDKFVNKLKKTPLLKNSNPLENYLKNTIIAKELQKSLHKKIVFNLVRKDKKWFIQHENILQALDKKDFAKFFVTILNKNLSITTDKKRDVLYDSDKFYFKVKSSMNGFLSILTVYEDGTVSSLVRNVPIKKGKIENIPDKDFETIPEAGLLHEGVETYDLYVLIYSNKKLRLDSFSYADENIIDEEKYKNFDELIEFLEGRRYATLKVVTKPKSY